MTRSVSRIKVRDTKATNLNALRKLAMSNPKTSRGRRGPPRMINRNILIDAKIGNYDYIFHATKGWRRRRR